LESAPCASSLSPSLSTSPSNALIYTKQEKDLQRTCAQLLANAIYGLCLLIFDVDDASQNDELTATHTTLLETVSKMGVAVFTEPEIVVVTPKPTPPAPTKEELLVQLQTLTQQVQSLT
jgi:hypothetical protein